MTSILKVGKVQSSTGNDAITVADSGALSFPTGTITGVLYSNIYATTNIS